MPVKRPQLMPLARTLLAVAVLTEVSIFLHGLSSKIADPDSFYHLRHAALYRERGLFDSSFPWLTQSIVGRIGSDLWYGFHLLSLPLTLGDPLNGIYRGAVVTTILSLVLFFLALTRLRARFALAGTLLFLFCTADTLYRESMFRPQPISLALTVLLVAESFAESGPRRQALMAAVCGFLVAWIHLPLFWAPVGALAVSLAAARVEGVPVRWRMLVFLPAGLAAGALLRPNPLGALKLLDVQLLALFAVKSHAVPLYFSHELDPYNAHDLAVRLLPFLLLLAAAGLLLCGSLTGRPRFPTPWAMPRGPRRAALLAAFVLAAGFWGVSFLSARRAGDLACAFSAVAVALAFTHLSEGRRRQRTALWSSGKWSGAALAGMALLGWMLHGTLHYYTLYMDQACAPYKFQEASVWMRANIPEKAVVFMPDWDEFPQLFFWDDRHRYINGMDPVFQYVYNPRYYWNTYFMMRDEAGRMTYDTDGGTSGAGRESYQFLKEDSRADYVLLRLARNPSFSAYLDSDARFQRVYGNNSVVVYRIL